MQYKFLHAYPLDKDLRLRNVLHTIYILACNIVNLNQPFGMDAFDSEMVEAALIYHRELAQDQARGYVPVEVSAFIAGASWAKQVLKSRENDTL